MFKKIKIFGRDSSSASQSGSTSSSSNSAANGYSPSKDSNNSTSIDKQSDAEGFLCPTCMQSFNDAELLQQHFTTAHAEPIPQATADRELELLKMQLTASEESRTLLSSELMNMQRQMQEMALNQPEPAPDQTAEVNRLNTQIQLLQIENTETHEKLQLAENSVQAVQESLKLSVQEQKTLTNTIAAEQEKYKLIAEQLAQEKTRNSTLQDEFKQTSGQLRKTEVAFEQLKSSAGRADEMQAKLSGKEELCRSLEQQIIDMKQNSIKYDSEISQLKKSLDAKDDTVARASAMHNEMKNAMESKVQSMEALIQEKTTSLDRILSENEQLQHKTQTLESRLSAIQTELTESTKKYDELHQNFVQKIDAGEGANVIVTQLKEDNARIQEKLKHAEEKAISEKEENYQKLKAVEALHKESNQITAKLTAEKQELCANVSQLETRISDLQEEHKKQTEALSDEHKEAVSQLHSSLLLKEDTIRSLHADIAAKQAELTQSSMKADDQAQELSSLQTQLSQHIQDLQALNESKTQLSSQLEEKGSEVSKLVETKKKMSEELSDKSNEVSSLKEQLTKMSAMAELKTAELVTVQQSLLSETEKHEQSKASWLERCSGLESDLKASEELLQEKLSALAQLQEDSAVLNEQLLAVKEQLSKSVADNTQLQSENNDLQLVARNLEEEKVMLGRETERLQGQSSNQLSQLNSTSTELEDSRKLVSEKNATLLQLQQQMEAKVQESENLQSSLLEQIDLMQSAAKLAEETKQTEISKFKADIENLQSELKSLGSTNADLTKEKASLTERLASAEQRLGEVQTTLNTSRQEVSALQEDLTRKTEDHTHVLQETTDILQRTSDENEALNKALTGVKAEVAVMEEQLQATQKNTDEWQSKHRLLQDDLNTLEIALTQEKTTSEETKQLLISHRLESQNKLELLEAEKLKLENELAAATKAKELAELQAEDNLATMETSLSAEKAKMEELEAKFNMQLVSLSENLSLNKADLTATQEKLMDVVKHNDELRGINLELETKLESSNDERTMLWNSETETKSLRDEREELRLQIENLNSALHELGRENQSLQIKTTKAQSRRWVEDDDVSDCTNCAKSFNVRVRKHHCRNCGNIFCHDCSSKQLMLPTSSKPSRVCDNCYTEIKR